MAEERGQDRSPPRPWWLGVAVGAVGGVWFYGGASLPQRAVYAEIGPGLFVTLVGAGLVLLGFLLLVQIARGERFEPQAVEDTLADAPAAWPAFFAAVAGAALPIVLMRPLGFPLTAALTFFLVAWALGSRRYVLNLALGGLLGSLCWYAFSLLGVTLGGFLPVLGY